MLQSLIIFLFTNYFLHATAAPQTWYRDNDYNCKHEHFENHEPARDSCIIKCPHDEECVDYIIVGLGAGGGLIGGRFAQECKNYVLAFDMGYPEFEKDLVVVPRYYLYNWNEPENWKTTLPFRTSPQKAAGDLTKNYMRGRGWGGSTTINGQVTVRGTKKNFDDWADIIGDDDWNFDNVLPGFKKVENNLWHVNDNKWHGHKGFFSISRVLQNHNEWVDHKNWLVWDSITNLHIPYVHDIHGDPKDFAGVSFCAASVGFDPETGHGTRSWVGKDLLKPAASKCDKFSIRSTTLVTKIIFDGTRAIGVEYISGKGVYSVEVNSTSHMRNDALHNKRYAFARKGVIIAGGAINTPQLLKLSGIGPKEELDKHGIQVIVDLPGVGENLQDHPEFTINYQFETPTDIDKLGCSYGTRGHNDPCADPYNLYYGTNGRVGILDWNFDENGEVECHSIMSTDYPIWDFDHLPKPTDGPFPVKGIFGWLMEMMNPKSRGSIYLKSADPTDAPIVNPRYLSHPDDYRKAKGCWDLIETIMSNDPVKDHLVGMFRPNPKSVSTEERVEDYIRNVTWGHHIVGTARMGRQCDKYAVLDTNLRPFGTQNLYVIDSSVMPKIISGQVTFATYMLAQKAYWKLKKIDKKIEVCDG